MVRIIVPIILLALALSAWYLEIQTKPESAAQANTVQPPPQGTSTTSTTTPTGSAQGEEASNAGPSGTVIPLDLPQSTGSEVIQLASQLESSISSLAPSTKSCLVVRERNSDSDQLLLSNLFEHNPQLSLVPASNQKLITAAAALLLLGPDYRFTTRVLAAQSPENGVITGDLYLVGGGDPLLYTDDYLDTFLRSPAVYTPIEELAQQLYDLGLRRVVGRIVGVESRYDDERKAAQAASFYFIGPLSALLINDGYENYQARRDLGIEPIPATDPAQFSAALFDDLLEDLGVVITSRPRSATASDDIGGFIQLASLESAPLSELLDSLLTDSDNTSAELLLKEIASYQNYLQSRVGVDDLGAVGLEEAASFGDVAGFGKAGLPVSASGDSPAFGAPQISDLESNQTDTTTSPPQDTDQPEDTTTSPPQDTAQPEDGPTITAPAFLATTTTEPEPDLTPTTEPESDFTTTEPERVIPAIEDPDENPLNILPGSTALGVQYVGEILIENGIQSWVGTPRDGSGLDRGNLLSCKVVADVLDYFGPDSDFASSLAVAGRTGTLQNSFLDTPLEGRLIGKTGSLPGVFALSGFIGSESESAKTVTFSFIVNFDQDETTEESIRAVRQDILLEVAAYLDMTA